jgi:hypothetical protein
MATILDLGKLRFHFAGVYDAATEYEMNDIVKYGGNVYVYSNVTRTIGNIPTNTAYWTLMVEGFKFRQIYDGATQYRVGDGVTHGGKVYICILDTQGNTPPNVTYWNQFADGIQWEGDFDNTKAYQRNDLVKYGSQVYIAKQDGTANLPTVTTYWDKFVEGVSPEGVYNAATNYVPGDLVAYGANIYRCIQNSTGNLPTATTYFENFITGSDFQGAWSSSANYRIGQTIRYGGNVYKALQDNINKQPDIETTDWQEFSTGVNSRGTWATAADYAINDVVAYGGNTYIVLVGHTSGTFATDLAAGKWQKFNSGIRYMGNWTTGTAYLKDDIVKSSVSTYICLIDHTAGSDFFIDLNTNNYWEVFVVGASYVLPATTGNAGKYLQTPDGATYSWQFAGANDKIFYVSEDSTSSGDDVNHGSAIDYAFASVRYACDYINADIANRTPATIFIKDGTYSEVLPIHIPVNTTIVGDGQRNCIIQPAGGNGDNGIPNSEETMFYVNTGTMIEGVILKGLTGFAIGTPTDLSTATIKGVYFRLEPGSTILKSPYIKESSAFSTGGVGAIVDGSVVATGTAGSMVFHTFTQVHDGGVGFWIKDNGLSEIVSCFTYYNTYGYVATGGGKIRALNGNNSYGTYGALSAGFATTEVPLSGYMYGDTVEYTTNTLNTPDGFTVGDIISYGNDASVAITSVSNEQQCTIVTSGAHGLAEGDPIAFSGVSPTAWQELLGSHSTANMYNRTWYADVVDATSFRICTNPDLNTYYDTRSVAGWGIVTETISDATRANPVVLTMIGHGYSNGDLVQNISSVGGMTQLNGNSYYANNVTGTTVQLYSDSGLTTTLDGTGYTAYTSGGTAERVLTGTAFGGGNILSFKTTAEVANIQTNLNPATKQRLVLNELQKGYTGQTFKVHVQNTGDGNKYWFDGQELPTLKLDTKHRMYIFEQNDITNNGHPLYFSITPDGTWNGGAEYTATKDAATGLSGNAVEYYLDGVKQVSLAAYNTGFNAATSREVWVVGATDDLYVACVNHSGMGGTTPYSTSDATYEPSSGIAVLTIGTHSLVAGDFVHIGTDSITFTCSLDGNATNHTYPRSTDPANTTWYVKIIDVGLTTITVNVGASPSGQQYVHSWVSATSNNVQAYTSNILIDYTSTTQHSTADAFRERFFGIYRYPFANSTTIQAQDGQSATLLATDANQGQFGFALVLAGLPEIPRAGASIEFITNTTYNPADNADITTDANYGADALTYIITAVSGYTQTQDPVLKGTCTVTLATEKQNTSATYYGQKFKIRYKYSQVRLTGHDFLSIGTGGRATTNYPGEPTQAASQGNEVTETYPGRVYYVSTDQDGNFRVGSYFRVDQATGRATLDASAFDLAGLTSLRLGSIGAQLGESINEFSSDGTLSGNSNLSVPTEQAVKTYVDSKTGTNITTVGTITSGTLGDGAAISTVTTSLGSDATGDVFYRNAGGKLTRLGIGNADESLTVSGSGLPQWAPASGGYSYELKSASFTAASGSAYLVDVSGGAVTATLPTSPTAGDFLMIIDSSGVADVNNITVARNGSKIHRKDDDLDIDFSMTALELVYEGTTNGWVITNLI